jgi:hypothetical protein
LDRGYQQRSASNSHKDELDHRASSPPSSGFHNSSQSLIVTTRVRVIWLASSPGIGINLGVV